MRWHQVGRTNPRGRRLADRHYNRRSVGADNFAPPGSPLPLVTADGLAVWVTMLQKAEYQEHAFPGALVNSTFRNEGAGRSSELILEAVAATRYVMGEPPPQGLITFIDPGKVRHKRDPGRCYLRAGFVHAQWTPGGHGRPSLRVLQLTPDRWPPAEPPFEATLRMEGVG